MALAKHLQIAQTQGPKAGFNAYMETLDRSGLDTVQALAEEIRSKGNKKAQFEFYCAKFGSKFGATPQRVDEGEDLAQQVKVLQARLAELQAQGIGVLPSDEDLNGVADEDNSLDEVDDGWDTNSEGDTAIETQQGRSLLQRALGGGRPRSSGRTNTTTKPKAGNGGNGISDKENLWRPWAVARFGIPTQVGGTFTYKSKRAAANTVHQVTRVTQDGVYAKRIK